MTYTLIEAFALSRVREHCAYRCRWQAAYQDRTRSGLIVEFTPRHRLDNNRAETLAELREHRAMLGPRWTNPIAWAVALGLVTIDDAMAAGMLRKLEQGSKS